MKILHTSDWHIGKNLYEFSLLENQREFLDWFQSICIEKSVDLILISGDVYDRPVPSAQAIKLYDDFLSKTVSQMGIPVCAIAGNHDSASRLEFGSSLYQKSGYYICGSPSKEIEKITLDEVDIWLLPYLHPSQARVLLEDTTITTFQQAYDALLKANHHRISEKRTNLLLAHGFFSHLQNNHQEINTITSDSEINIGGIDIVNSTCFEDFDYIALGHLHAPQWVEPNKVRYSGSPLKYSLSESHQKKSVTLLTLEQGVFSSEILPIPYRQDVRKVRGSLEELMEPSWHENNHFDDFVFAEITGPEQPFAMEKLRSLFPFLLGLSFQTEQADSSEIILQKGRIQQAFTPVELFERFYIETTNETLSSQQQKIVQEVFSEVEAEDYETT